jgi:hypothetical protein
VNDTMALLLDIFGSQFVKLVLQIADYCYGRTFEGERSNLEETELPTVRFRTASPLPNTARTF